MRQPVRQITATAPGLRNRAQWRKIWQRGWLLYRTHHGHRRELGSSHPGRQQLARRSKGLLLRRRGLLHLRQLLLLLRGRLGLLLRCGPCLLLSLCPS